MKPKTYIALMCVMSFLVGFGGAPNLHAQTDNYEVINQQQRVKLKEFINRRKAILQQPASPERDLQLKQEIQSHMDENKKLSLQKEAARRKTVSDLKQKWDKVESDWKKECARHDAEMKKIEKTPDGPERAAKIEAEKASHRAKSKEIAVERNVVHEGVVEQANREVVGGSKNVSNAAKQTAGTKVSDPNHRGMNGDFDAGGGYRTTEKMEKILNEMGVKNSAGGPVKVKNGVLETSSDFGMTVNADAAADRIGSAGHQAQVKQAAAHGETYVSETAGAVKSQTLKDHLATLDHSKKAMHGLNENPEALVGGSPEGQAMAKGALKAADQAKLAPETVEAIARQNGIKDPKNLMDKLAEIKAGKSTITNPEEAAKLQSAAKDILSASEKATKAKADAEVKQTETKIDELKSKGQTQEAQKLRDELADYRAKADVSKKELAHPEKSPVTSGPEPTKIRSSPAARGESAPRTGRTVSTEPVMGEPELKTTGGSKLISKAGLALGVYGIYEGYQTAKKEMEEKKQGEPKSIREWVSTKAELTGRTLWHGLGFGTMAEIGWKAGQESFEQYKKDIASGKVSKDSWGSYIWMKSRAVLGGLYQGAKAISYDAAKQTGTSLGEAGKEGTGLVKDLSQWAKDVRNEKRINEDRSKKVYDKLIKEGASPVGAQRAADGVKNGDFTEAKRLAKILEGKRAAKNQAIKKEKESESPEKVSTARERKKKAIKKEEKKKTSAPKSETDHELEMRGIVLEKLRAKGLPTGDALVDRLVSILEKSGMPALDAAINEMAGMQGVFTGSMAGEGILRITVQGEKVTGSFSGTETIEFTSGNQTTTTDAEEIHGTIQGDVDLSSGSLAMTMNGTSTPLSGGGAATPVSAKFSGSFTGKGYKGSVTVGTGETASWSISREG